jgi:KDO2-lipid IV(A) lauroyltransferase
MNQYVQYRIMAALARTFPLKFGYWFGMRVADLFWRRNTAGRQAVVSNLRQICLAGGITTSDEVLNSLARKTFQYFGKYLADFFRYTRLSEADMRRLISFQNRPHMDEAARAGRGVILVTAHYGNWELGGSGLSALGYPINAVALSQEMEKLDQLFNAQRARRGIRVLPLGSSAMALVHCLKRGEMVALLADRDFTPRGVEVDFFGRRTCLPRGPAWLSLKTRAPIVPSFLFRLPDDSFLHRFYPPMWPQDYEDVAALQQHVAQVLEAEISQNPTQWFIFDDFWAPVKPPPPRVRSPAAPPAESPAGQWASA